MTNFSDLWKTPPASPRARWGQTEASRKLGVRREAAAELILSEHAGTLLGTVQSTAAVDGPSLTISADGMDALSALPWVSGHPEVVNLRVRAARTIDDDDRDVMGYHASMTSEQVETAVLRWWQVRDERALVDMPLIATIAGFVVAQGRITDTSTSRGLVAFHIERDAKVDKIFFRRRIVTPRGGPIVVIEKNAGRRS